MAHMAFIEEFQRLTLAERLRLIDHLLQLVLADIGQESTPLGAGTTDRVGGILGTLGGIATSLGPNARHARDVHMREAAQALLADYVGDEELTAFTALDGEDFYAHE